MAEFRALLRARDTRGDLEGFVSPGVCSQPFLHNDTKGINQLMILAATLISLLLGGRSLSPEHLVFGWSYLLLVASLNWNLAAHRNIFSH